MSRRQRERTSLFRGEIETGVRSAAVELHDNDVEVSVTITVRLWWTSRLRGRRFAQLCGPTWWSPRCTYRAWKTTSRGWS
jgi:hypothetical protein